MSSNLPRVTQYIFGENAGENIGQFGSALAGQGVPTGDIAQIQALSAWAGGWNSAVISERDYPPLEEMTGVQKVETQQIAYLFQKGIPEWDEGTTYFANISFCQINGIVYRSLTDNNLGNNPETDSTNWEVWKPLEGTYANIDLSNITSTAYDNINQSKALSTGNVSSNSEVYSDIQNYAHSTFDLSKFTVVGSPTLSDDGILTASSLNYVTFKNVNLTTASSWRIKGKFTYNEDLSSVQVIFTQLGAYGIQIYFASSNKMTFQGSFNGSSWKFQHVTSNIFINGQTYHYIIEFTGIQYNLWISTDNISYEIWASYTSSEKISALNNTIVYAIGSSGIANRDFKGSIDLKSIAIWADGVPVFNGNITGTDTINEIQIPYTLSKTGSKIVDVAYRGRVQDLYTQTGEALYYTIDEQNQNFTLPMGEVYGMITQKANVDLTNLTNGLANVICTTSPEIKNYGVNIAGSLTNDNNVLSGFSVSNYATVNSSFNPSNSPWEINLKFTTGSDVTTQQNILSFNQTTEWNLNVSNGHFSLYIGTNDITSGTYTILSNSIYYIKIQYSNGSFTVKYSLNGTSYTQDITRIYTLTIPSDGVFSLGHDLGDSSGRQAFKGSIDLSGCNILINNSQIWQGLTPTNNVYPTAQNPAVVVDGYINGTSGYRVWSDGYCEQWGYILSVNKTATITLLKEMIDTNYSIICTGTEATGGNDNGSMNAYNPTTTGFNIYNTSDNVSNCYWRVYGYIS